MKDLSIYIHIPYCTRKCLYCSFYSVCPGDVSCFLDALKKDIIKGAKKAQSHTVQTIYFGGGTPLLLGAENIAKLIEVIKNNYDCTTNEITVECNPISTTRADLTVLKDAGVNRLSVGMQSVDDSCLESIGRLHRHSDTVQLIYDIKATGFSDFSLDLMLGIPNQTYKTIDTSLSFIKESGAKHVSSYMLKIEEGTPFYKMAGDLNLPSEDEMCDHYEYVVSKLGDIGLLQYEISNFAVPSFESIHNSGYWTGTEYLGFGPSAHSYFGGKRFYYPQSLESYTKNAEAISDGEGGSFEEVLMLGLRLVGGISIEKLRGIDAEKTSQVLIAAEELIESGMVIIENGHIKICSQNFLIFNTIFSKFTT